MGKLTKRTATSERFESIDLGVLKAHDAEQLVAACEALSGVPIRSTVRESVLKRAGGHPLFVVELLRHQLAKTSTAEPTAAGVQSSPDIPGTIERLLLQRLATLNSTQARIIGVLAVLGGQATVTLLVKATRLSAQAVAAVVEELVRRHIVMETASTVTFVHDLMREAASARLSDSARQVLHRLVADALKDMPHPAPGSIALHMQAGGRIEEVFRYAMAAAKDAARLFAHSETEFFIRLGLACAQDEPRRLEALDQLCRHLYSLGRHADVAELIGDLEPWYARSGNREGLLLAAVVELQVALAAGENPVADLGRRARNLAELVVLDIEAMRAAEAVGSIIEAAHESGHTEFITDFSNTVYQRARRSEPSATRAQVLAMSAKAIGIHVDARRGYEMAEEGLRAAQTVGDPASEVVASIACGTTGMLAGFLIAARLHFERALELTGRLGLTHYRKRVWNNYGALLIDEGRFEEATRVLTSALEVSTVHDRLYLFGNLGLIAVEEERWQAVREYAERLAEANAVLQLPLGDLVVQTLEGYAALAAGEDDRCRRSTTRIIELREEANCGVWEDSYVEILLCRAGALGSDPLTLADLLGNAASRCRTTNATGAARLDMEQAEVLASVDPVSAVSVAERTARWAREAGAQAIHKHAERFLESRAV